MIDSDEIKKLEDELKGVNGKFIIYGAHLVAAECLRYIKYACKNARFLGFAVTSMADNPDELEGYPVRTIGSYDGHSDAVLIIAAPRKYHNDIKKTAEKVGFKRLIAVSLEGLSVIVGRNARAENNTLTECPSDPTWLDVQDEDGKQICKYPTLYYRKLENFETALNAQAIKEKMETEIGVINSKPDPDMIVYMAFGEGEIENVKKQELPRWIRPLQVGCANAMNRLGNYFDDESPHISDLNPLLAEMTGTYWIWKHAPVSRYKGLCHYRRHFSLTESDVKDITNDETDVIMTTPRYVPGGIGNFFLAETPVKREVFDSIYYAFDLFERMGKSDLYSLADFQEYLKKEFYFPNNMVIAKSEIFDNYCEWLFPILLQMYEYDKSEAYGHFNDRHIAYSAEILTAYYFTDVRRDIRRITRDYIFLG